MTVKFIKIRNVLGISDIEFEPGKITQIRGANGTGKTSILNAIRSVIKVGGAGQLLREGEEQGEIVLVLDDDTEIGRRFTKDRTYPFAHQGGMKATSPVSFIANLTGEYALNPIEFIYSDDKRRTDFLLSCVPGQLDFDQLGEIMGYEVDEQALPAQPIAAIDYLRECVFVERTGTNRAVKESEATIARLQESVPENPRSVDELKAQITQIEGQRDQKKEEFNLGLEAADEKLRAVAEELNDEATNIDAELTRNKAEAQRQVSEIRKKLEEKERESFEKIKQIEEKKFAEERAYNSEKEKLSTTLNDDLAPLRAEFAAVQEKISEAGRVANTLDMLADEKKRAETFRLESKAATKQITQLDGLKSSMLSELPVKDLFVEDGKLLYKGLPFENVNMAEKVRIAFELSRLQAGDLGLVCVDGLEMLDTEHYAELVNLAERARIQLIVTQVSDEPLEIL